MGKKEREKALLRGKGRVGENDNDNDNGNENDTEPADEEQRARGAAEAMASMLDDALESRATTRVAAFEKLAQTMARDYDAEAVEHALPSLKLAASRALKKAAEAKSGGELVAVLRAIELATVTLGVDAEAALFGEFDSALKAMLKERVEPRAALWQTLALLTFVAAADEAHALALMDLLTPDLSRAAASAADAVSTATAAAAATAGAALRCWGFLASIVAPDVVVRRLFESHLPLFVQMLASPVADVHVPAANNVALLFDNWRAAMALDGRADLGIEECAVVDVADVRDRVAALAHNVAKQAGASEPNKRHWRVMLRRVARALTVDDDAAVAAAVHADDQPGDDVYDQLEFDNQRVLVQDFAMLIQVDFFRTVLGTGFAAHMTHNPLLRDVFGDASHAKPSKPQSSFQKRRENDKVTKERDRGRYKGRDLKQQKNTLAASREFAEDDIDDE